MFAGEGKHNAMLNSHPPTTIAAYPSSEGAPFVSFRNQSLSTKTTNAHVCPVQRGRGGYFSVLSAIKEKKNKAVGIVGGGTTGVGERSAHELGDCVTEELTTCGEC